MVKAVVTYTGVLVRRGLVRSTQVRHGKIKNWKSSLPSSSSEFNNKVVELRIVGVTCRQDLAGI